MGNDSAIQTQKQETGIVAGVKQFLSDRSVFKEQVLPYLAEKQDYYTIMGKKSLAKGGAEKLSTIFGLTAEFQRDNETIEMLGGLKGTLAFICNLKRNGQFAGQGRGADSLARNQNDPNKTIKMAQKRAYVDAVIRTTGLSDIFTQDLEDNGHQEPTYHPDTQTSQKSVYFCDRCDKKFNRQTKITPAEADYSRANFNGLKLCRACQGEAKKAQSPTPSPQAPQKPKSSPTASIEAEVVRQFQGAKPESLKESIARAKSMGSGKVNT